MQRAGVEVKLQNYVESWALARIRKVVEEVNAVFQGGAPIVWARETRPELMEAVYAAENVVREAHKKLAEDPSAVGEFEAACRKWRGSFLKLFEEFQKSGGEKRQGRAEAGFPVAPAPPESSGNSGSNGNSSRNGSAKAIFSVSPEAALNPEIVMVTSVEDLRSALAEIAAAGVCGLDTETAGPGKTGGLDPHVGEIRLVQVAVPSASGVKVFVADMYQVKDFSPFWELWSDDGVLKVLHNAKFDLKFFRKHLGRRLPLGRLFDTMLASQLIACGLDVGSHSLAACCQRFLGIHLDKEERLSDWSRELSRGQIEYAAKDPAVLLPLAAAEMKGLAKESLNRVAKIEFDCVFPTSELEFVGIGFDKERCLKLLEEEEAREKEARAKLMRELAPALEEGLFGAREINPNSPAQLLPVLRKLGLDVASTLDDELRLKYPDHPAVRALLEYRKCEKRLTAFLRPYLEAVHSVTGRVHASFTQINKRGVGRFSCQDPNVQQSPREKEFRALFAAPEGRKLVICDYGQIELRIMAWLSKDVKMVEAYRKGSDLHTLTAAMTAGVSPEQVTKEMRQRAKACFSGDTEILTVNGWVRFDEYDGKTPVAQFWLPSWLDYNQKKMFRVDWDGLCGKIQFTTPLAFEMFKNRETVHVFSKVFDLLVTDDHEIIYLDYLGRPWKKALRQIKPRSVQHMIAAGQYENTVFSLTPIETRILAMIAADGKIDGNRVIFRFKRDEKVIRCRALLKEIGWNYQEHLYENGVVKLVAYLSADWFQKINNYLNPETRELKWKCMLELNGRVYLDEAKYWDSHIHRSSLNGEECGIYFTSIRKQTIDVMQAMAVLNGIPAVSYKEVRNNGNRFYRTGELLYLRYNLNRAKPIWTVRWRAFPAGKKDVYCVQVPSGAIVVRRNGKVCIQGNCNFGMIYGISAKTFQQYAKTNYGVDMSEEEAVALREAFFRAYPGVAAWHKKQKAFVQANRFACTVAGRKRKWLEGQDFPITQAFNSPDQGSGADILKTSMIYIYRELFSRNQEDVFIVNSVHDELLLECPENMAEETAILVKEKMEKAWYDLMGDEVPIEAEPVIGDSWADK